MNNYKNLYKLIDGLNNKIKILESDVLNLVDKNKSSKIINNDFFEKNLVNSKMESYKISSLNNLNHTKKFVGLMFNNNLHNFNDLNYLKIEDNLLSFIKLPKSNIVINYFIQLELNFTSLKPIICTLALGIRSKYDSKIKIIKGTKHMFNIDNSKIMLGYINLIHTTIYMSEGNEELCMIADFGSFCKVNSKKSLIKLLYFY